jgi:hypothetical protein
MKSLRRWRDREDLVATARVGENETRPEKSTPATGNGKVHNEQKQILDPSPKTPKQQIEPDGGETTGAGNRKQESN